MNRKTKVRRRAEAAIRTLRTEPVVTRPAAIRKPIAPKPATDIDWKEWREELL
jgi:hypothetical protein